MEKLGQLFQVILAAVQLCWAVYMIIRLVAGGYDALYVVCFAFIALIGYNLLRISIRELKGGAE